MSTSYLSQLVQFRVSVHPAKADLGQGLPPGGPRQRAVQGRRHRHLFHKVLRQLEIGGQWQSLVDLLLTGHLPGWRARRLLPHPDAAHRRSRAICRWRWRACGWGARTCWGAAGAAAGRCGVDWIWRDDILGVSWPLLALAIGTDLRILVNNTWNIDKESINKFSIMGWFVKHRVLNMAHSGEFGYCRKCVCLRRLSLNYWSMEIIANRLISQPIVTHSNETKSPTVVLSSKAGIPLTSPLIMVLKGLGVLLQGLGNFNWGGFSDAAASKPSSSLAKMDSMFNRSPEELAEDGCVYLDPSRSLCCSSKTDWKLTLLWLALMALKSDEVQLFGLDLDLSPLPVPPDRGGSGGLASFTADWIASSKPLLLITAKEALEEGRYTAWRRLDDEEQVDEDGGYWWVLGCSGVALGLRMTTPLEAAAVAPEDEEEEVGTVDVDVEEAVCREEV